jgi:hypothetical protein
VSDVIAEWERARDIGHPHADRLRRTVAAGDALAAALRDSQKREKELRELIPFITDGRWEADEALEHQKQYLAEWASEKEPT